MKPEPPSLLTSRSQCCSRTLSSRPLGLTVAIVSARGPLLRSGELEFRRRRRYGVRFSGRTQRVLGSQIGPNGLGVVWPVTEHAVGDALETHAGRREPLQIHGCLLDGVAPQLRCGVVVGPLPDSPHEAFVRLENRAGTHLQLQGAFGIA